MAESQRVALASTYLNNIGDVWFQGWSRVRDGCNWYEFVKGLCERFKDRGMMDIVKEFNKLK